MIFKKLTAVLLCFTCILGTVMPVMAEEDYYPETEIAEDVEEEQTEPVEEPVTEETEHVPDSDILLSDSGEEDGFRKVRIQSYADSGYETEFSVFFSEYDGILPEDPEMWDSYFSDACTGIVLKNTENINAAWVSEKGTLSFILPAGTSSEFEILILSESEHVMMKASADGNIRDYLPIEFVSETEKAYDETEQNKEEIITEEIESEYDDNAESEPAPMPEEVYGDDDEFELMTEPFVVGENENGIRTLAAENEAFAVYSADDTSLTFAYGEVPEEGGIYNGKTVTNLYTGFERTEYSASNKIPWYSARLNATSVVIEDSFVNADITSLQWWFNNFHYASFSGLENINTSNVTSMKSTFYDCDEFDTFDSLSAWDTSQVTSMESMFYSCDQLYNVDALSGWDTGNVTTFYDTFCKCSNLTNVDGLASWDVSSATKLYYMFSNCSSLENTDGLASWNTASASDLADMFYECESLENADGLTNWDMSAATSLQYMFYGCTALKEIDISKWDTSNVTKMGRLFNGCSDLVTIYSDDDVFVTDAVTSGVAMFTGCTNLIGGNGTAYDSDNVTYTMAHVDKEDNPGYFTYTKDCTHVYTSEVTKEATCIDDGEITYTCSKCGDSYTEVIPATGVHNYVEDIIKEATCLDAGETKYTCSVCGDSYTEVVSATGKHDYKAEVIKKASCTEDGETKYTCTVCNDSYTETVKATGHTAATDKAVSATCTKTGLTEGSHCSVCGTVIKKQSVTEKLGHNYKWVTDKKADYGIKGSRHQECTRCGAKGKTESIAAKSVGRLYPQAKSVKKNSQKISWNSAKGATKYVVYGAKCGNSFKKLATVKSGTSYTHKNLKSGTYYKYYVVAYNGSTKIKKSYTIHSCTKGGKYGNPSKPTVKKSSLTIKAGKTKKMNAAYKVSDSVKKHTSKLRYYSSDTSIAKVNSSGMITGIKKGTCNIYAVTQNGKKVKIKITVK